MAGKLVGQVAGVMVINQCHGADRRRVVGAVHLLFHQGIANHVANGLGAVVITFSGNHLVKAAQQALVDGNAKASEFGHVVLTGCGLLRIFTRLF